MTETPEATQQAERIRELVDEVIAIGPGFLDGKVPVQDMTDAMIGAVRTYEAEETAAGRDGGPLGARSRKLAPVLKELITCGGGYQAGRCDADCVARTMTELVHEFGAPEAG